MVQEPTKLEILSRFDRDMSSNWKEKTQPYKTFKYGIMGGRFYCEVTGDIGWGNKIGAVTFNDSHVTIVVWTNGKQSAFKELFGGMQGNNNISDLKRNIRSFISLQLQNANVK